MNRVAVENRLNLILRSAYDGDVMEKMRQVNIEDLPMLMQRLILLMDLTIPGTESQNENIREKAAHIWNAYISVVVEYLLSLPEEKLPQVIEFYGFPLIADHTLNLLREKTASGDSKLQARITNLKNHLFRQAILYLGAESNPVARLDLIIRAQLFLSDSSVVKVLGDLIQEGYNGQGVFRIREIYFFLKDKGPSYAINYYGNQLFDALFPNLNAPVYDELMISRLLSLSTVVDKANVVTWSGIQYFLAQKVFMKGDPQSDDLAIYYYNRALSALQPNDRYNNWTRACFSMGCAWHDRKSGDKNQNLEEALGMFEKIVEAKVTMGVLEEHLLYQRMGSCWLKLKGTNRKDNLEKAFAYFQKALALVNFETEASGWASANYNLGLACEALAKYNDGEKYLKAGTQYFENATRVFTKTKNAVQWADIRQRTGSLYEAMAFNNIADEKLSVAAIECFTDALSVFNLNNYPGEFAASNLSLARVLLYWLNPDLMDSAIPALENCLKVYNKINDPAEWAEANWMLAMLYGGRKSADAFQTSISYYASACEVFTKEHYPAQRRHIMKQMAEAYLKHSDQASLDKARACYEEAIACSQGAGTAEQAELHQELAALLTNLQENSIARKEEAIDHLSTAAALYLELGESLKLAEAWKSLAFCYFSRQIDTKAANLERGIEFIKKAEGIYTKEKHPEEWAELQMELGNIYSERTEGSLNENMEISRQYFETALAAVSEIKSPLLVANIRFNMAITLCRRQFGDKEKDVEEAIKLFELALPVRNRSHFPAQWVSTMINLSNAYRMRFFGDIKANKRRAISLLEEVIDFTSQNNLYDSYISAVANLGAAYGALSQVDPSVPVEKVIQIMKDALLKIDKGRAEYVVIAQGLSLAYSERKEGDSTENFQQSVYYVNEMIDNFRKTGDPYGVAQGHLWLAKLYASRRVVDGKNYVPMAYTCFEQAAKILNTKTALKESRELYSELGDLLYSENRYAESKEAFQKAHEALELLRLQSMRYSSKKLMAQRNAAMYKKLVHCCLETGDTDNAFYYAMAAKSRALNDLIYQRPEALQNLADKNPSAKKLLESIYNLRARIDGIQHALQDIYSQGNKAERDAVPAHEQELTIARQMLSTQIKELVLQFPSLSVTEPAPLATTAELRSLSSSLPDVTLLEYYRHQGGWGVFVVSEAVIDHVSLPDADQKTIQLLVNWLFSFEAGNLLSSSNDAINSATSLLFEAFFRPLTGRNLLKNKVVLAPFEQMHLLPLHLALDTISHSIILQCCSPVVVPSLASFLILHQKHKGRHNKNNNLLCVNFSPVSGNRMLPAVINEFDRYVPYFEPAPLSARLEAADATPAKVIAACERSAYEVIHFGCHGLFDFDNPDHSGLELHGGMLTVEQITSELRLEQLPLVVLGACETARSRPEEGEESIGLIQAFLSAGAGGIISTLWSVDDQFASDILAEFYKQRKNSSAPDAEVLRHVLLNLKNSEHCFYWGAFQYTGLF
jgi:hypothetical protein